MNKFDNTYIFIYFVFVVQIENVYIFNVMIHYIKFSNFKRYIKINQARTNGFVELVIKIIYYLFLTHFFIN